MKPLNAKQQAAFDTAKAQVDAGQISPAEPVLRELAKKTGHGDVLLALARCHLARGKFSDARSLLQKVHRINPNAVVVHLYLALCHRQAQQLEPALKALDSALRIRPGMPEALAHKAELLHAQGDYSAAFELLDPLVQGGTTDGTVLLEYGRLCRLLGRTDDAVAPLETAAAHGHGLTAIEAHFELAAIREKQQQYDDAWASAERGNRALPDRYDTAGHQRLVDDVCRVWTRDAIAALPTAMPASDVPIFIVGMPRSGTTLVEQILGSHPDVAAGGERSAVHHAVREIQAHGDGLPARIDDLTTLTPNAVNRAAKRILKDLRSVSRTAAHVTDKQPFNFMYLGLLARLFPDATFIHCRRDPRDIAVSCWFKSFRGDVWFANRLESIAHFQSLCDQFMTHWRDVLDIEIIDVEYETLTANPEPATRALLDAAGLAWDDQCLAFHENERVAWTESIDQVRVPMYRSSVARWKQYEAQLNAML